MGACAGATAPAAAPSPPCPAPPTHSSCSAGKLPGAAHSQPGSGPPLCASISTTRRRCSLPQLAGRRAPGASTAHRSVLHVNKSQENLNSGYCQKEGQDPGSQVASPAMHVPAFALPLPHQSTVTHSSSSAAKSAMASSPSCRSTNLLFRANTLQGGPKCCQCLDVVV